MNLWDEVLAKVEAKVNRHSFATWFRPTTFQALQGSNLLVQVPNPQFKDWLARNYHGIIAESLHDLGRAEVHVVFECESASAAPPEGGSEREAVAVSTALNPKYTFESFVVGSSNQFAHAAARAVAEIPSKSYNPLFLYGGVGLGKTHLMHAIGHYIQARNRHLNLVYISSDRFINEMINAIRFDRLPAFRQKYRAVDVLLVDDIQFIAGKDRTQEEFFHIFNALHDAQKQIVISSDCPPRQIPTLEERLHSRFEWGLIADIQAPDIETKVAILRKKAEAERVEIPENVALFIASKVRTNIRELEGSLIRLIAYASLTGRDIDLTLAQEILRDLLHTEDKPITIEMIQKFVADQFGVKITELKAKNNSKTVAEPRQIAMYLIKNLTAASLPEIGKAFGGKHHSTVIHSVRKIDTLRKRDPEFDRRINSFVQAFR
ncbi:MAG TPA: chromosomal replication initiator protein DnaA [Vicinamibacteria bacterium]|jgi:chromosomal replication initiator protein|nr:chromosomal replication initiator protein DnaA [Vicinamibacteria bacterium]